jgi:hypothetical protein
MINSGPRLAVYLGTPSTMRSSALRIVGPAYPVGPSAVPVGQLVAHCVGLAQRPGGRTLLGLMLLLWLRPRSKREVGRDSA